MRPRNSGLVLVAVMLVASVVFVAPAAATGHHPPPCDTEYVSVDGNRITVLPSGGDDTANLQCALDYGAARPWAKVLLIGADYSTSFLEVEGFHGVFRGEGRHKTNLMTLPQGLDCLAREAEVGEVSFVTFAASKVIVRGMSFAVGGAAACAEPLRFWVDQNGSEIVDSSINGLLATTRLRSTGMCLNASIDHGLQVYDLGVVGEYPPHGAPLVEKNGFATGVRVARPLADSLVCNNDWLHGTVIVRGSHVVGAEFAIAVTATEASTAYIGGTKPWQGNTLEDIGFGVLSSAHNSSRIVVKGNRITDAHINGAFADGTEYDSAPSRFVFTKNIVSAIDHADGVHLSDTAPYDGSAPRIEPLIAWNHIETAATDSNGISALGTDGRIIGNKITGAGATGITLTGLGYFDEDLGEFVNVFPSRGWHIANNWFPGFDPEIADIVLDEATADNTVVCRRHHHEVLDLGVDNELINCE